MTSRRVAAAAILVFGMGLTGASAAPYLQPDMRTMIQQGGVEGTVIGNIFGPYVVYEPVYVPVAYPAHGSRLSPRKRALVQRHRHPYAHRGLQHVTTR